MKAYYLHKANQCDRLSKETTDLDKRFVLESEGKLWREIAAQVDASDQRALEKLLLQPSGVGRV